ncbi:two-component sensor histidine kinase, partial [Burkholderia multivorans]
GVAELQRNAAVRVDRTTNALKSTLDRYESLPYLLGSHPYVQELLAAPKRADYVARTNRYLEDLNEHAHATVTYVIGADGLCVAASNWRAPDSFVGIEYRFRPYFIDAMHGRVGRFFGIGTISRDPGYYISQPVWRDGGIAGVVVVKLNLEWFQGADASEPLVVADEHGVVFLSSVPAWKYHTLKPLTEPVAASIFETRQYAQQPVTPLPMRVEQVLGGDAEIVRVGSGRRAPRFLATRRRIGEPDWQLVTLAPIAPVDADARNATIVTGFGFVSVALLAFYWRMRRARVREMIRSRALLQQAYAELNRRVEERTADLSEANEQLQKEVGDRIRAEQELRAAHEEVVHAGKLAVLGQMAAGLTHELNQPLVAIRTLCDNARTFFERDQPAQAFANLERIGKLVDGMAVLTGELKTFARKPDVERVAVSLNEAVAHARLIYDARLRDEGVQLDVNIAPGTTVSAESSQLQQVIVNLLGNALDAVHDAPVRRIAIAADAPDAHGRVRFTVTDSGAGIAPDVLPHLFEPFVTTKPRGQGLGLGLAITSRIVEGFGAKIAATNRDGGGAQFTIEFAAATPQRTEHGR